MVSILRGLRVVGCGHLSSDGFFLQSGLHRLSFSDPGLSHENGVVVSGGKYSGAFDGLPRILGT